VGAAAATGRIMGPLCDGAPVPRVSFKAAARDAAGFPGVIPARRRRRVGLPRSAGVGGGERATAERVSRRLAAEPELQMESLSFGLPAGPPEATSS